MTPARRTTLTDMARAGEVEVVPIDATVCRTMVEQARRHALTAAAGRDLGDLEGALQIAYDGCRKVCLALALACRARPTGDAHHAATFAAAKAALTNLGRSDLHRLIDDAHDLRYVRSGAEYRAEAVKVQDVQDALDILHELLADVVPAMESRLT